MNKKRFAFYLRNFAYAQKLDETRQNYDYRLTVNAGLAQSLKLANQQGVQAVRLLATKRYRHRCCRL